MDPGTPRRKQTNTRGPNLYTLTSRAPTGAARQGSRSFPCTVKETCLLSPQKEPACSTAALGNLTAGHPEAAWDYFVNQAGGMDADPTDKYL